jgi:hypothetical protein
VEKGVNDILILTNITIAAAGAAVCDQCTSRLAFVVYRDSLRKYIKTGIFRLKELHTFPQYCLPKFVEIATIESAAELVLPQLPRPGLNQVPYRPKDQHHEEETMNDAYSSGASEGGAFRVDFVRCWYGNSKDGKDEGKESE